MPACTHTMPACTHTHTHTHAKHANYWPQQSCGQGNIFTPVCHSVHRGSASVHAGIPPTNPPEGRPPGRQTPLGGRPPGSRHPLGGRPPRRQTPPGSRHPPGSRLWHMVNEQPVCILLECILVSIVNGCLDWVGGYVGGWEMGGWRSLH